MTCLVFFLIFMAEQHGFFFYFSKDELTRSTGCKWIFKVFVSNFNVMLGFSRTNMDLVAHHGLMVELLAILDPTTEVSCSALSSSIWLIKPHLSDIVTEVLSPK